MRRRKMAFCVPGSSQVLHRVPPLFTTRRSGMLPGWRYGSASPGRDPAPEPSSGSIQPCPHTLENLGWPTGEPTTLHESVFSTIPGSPAYVGRAEYYRSKVPALGHDLDLQNHNAIQGAFRFVA